MAILLSARPFPRTSIPLFPQAGRPFALADRQDEVEKLYAAVVAAGNPVLAHERSDRYRAVVSGYKGVGKSSVIYKVLEMIRSADAIAEGVTFSQDVPQPESRERWLILSASGKHVPSVDAIAGALQKAMLSTLDDVEQEAERQAPGMVEIKWYHHLFRRREKQLFAEVQSALMTFSLMIDFVRAWQGSKLKESVERSSQTDVSKEIDAFLEGQLKGRGVRPESAEGQATLRASGRYIRKVTAMAKASASMEREVVISADLVTEALNEFFDTTERAGLPTILVLDDFDEFASNVGPSHAERSRVLASVLGTFNQLRPSCLIIGVREEYAHEDLFRQFITHHVPAMTRAAGGEALDAWAAVQRPPLSVDATRAFRAFGDRFLQRFAPGARVVVPFRFLQMVSWIGNDAFHRGASDEDRILYYFQSTFNGEVCRAIEHLAGLMPESDIQRSAEAVPLDPAPYKEMTSYEQRALVSAGLLRPAMAGDTEDERIVIDPLIAYFRAAAKAPAP
jgi:Cdc6-like AAA superfamily ATPase